MKKLGLIFIMPICLFAQLQMQRISFINSGIHDITNGKIVCSDVNHNGVNEMIWGLHNSSISYYMQWQVWEYQPINRYQLVYADTGWPVHGPYPLGIKTGNLDPMITGYLDNDSSCDLVGGNQEIYNLESIPRALSTVQEGPFSTSYPTSLVWFDRLGSWIGLSSPHYITDLDQDGRKEILFRWYQELWNRGTRIYENTGNNQYQLVFYQPPESWSDYAIKDFDQDGRTEFAFPSTLTHLHIRECISDNQYPVVCSLPFPQGLTNPYDCWESNDVDQDGKPEFFIAFDVEPTFFLYMWEATGNNTYERTFIDQKTISGTSSRGGRISKCGDIDGDGIEEIVWATHKAVFTYKAIGNNQFQQVWSWWQDHGNPSCIVNIYDMNKNGYNEVIVGGGGKTSIFEVEAVRLLRPNGGEVFQDSTQELIRWQKFYPPRCDSLSLFYSTDNGRTYQSIIHSLQSADTSYLWTVPNVNSDSCKVKIIAYGPGWQYDETDGLFSISSSAISEIATLPLAMTLGVKVFPNPAKSVVRVRYTLLVEEKATLQLFDISGRLVTTLVDETKKPGNYSLNLNSLTRSVDGAQATSTHNSSTHNSKTLSAGVYFLSLQTESKRIIEKFVIVK
jgi:hypothetical protein